MAGRYVEIPASALMGELRAIGASVAKRGGSFVEGCVGQETVVDIFPPGARVQIRIYTSLARGADVARDCGADAVRIVICASGIRDGKPSMYTLEESDKILRTAPAKLSERERVAAFLERLRGRVRDAYVAAVRRPSCPKCARAMATRKTRDKTREFYGCIGYPQCNGAVSK
jgi:hypothetical protein